MYEYIESIVIIFENCESLTIKGKDVAYLNLWSEHGKFNLDTLEGVVFDNYFVNLDIDLSELPKEQAADLVKRKDITYLRLKIKGLDNILDDTLTFQVAYPCYFDSWLPNPYQDNEVTINEESGHNILNIYIHKYWSLLSIRQWLTDQVKSFFRYFPRNVLWMLESAWLGIKDHLKWRH